jgi:hypothetical protein
MIPFAHERDISDPLYQLGGKEEATLPTGGQAPVERGQSF